MPKLPRDVTQERAIKAFVRCGGVAVARQGKGSHRKVLMPNGHTVTLPHGIIKPGLLVSALKESELTVEDFLDAL